MMLQINWTIMTYFVIGLFALAGYFRGWWKEAITGLFLGFLVFLLQFPEVAQWAIEGVNRVIETVWGWLPDFFRDFLNIQGTPQFDAGSGQTWLIILILLLALSIIIGRAGLRGYVARPGPGFIYIIKPSGSFMGGVLGALNGFLLINLVREYLVGGNLPPGNRPTTEIVMAAGESVAVASSGVAATITGLPPFTPFNTVWAWLVIGFGVLLALLAYKRRDWGYKKYQVAKK